MTGPNGNVSEAVTDALGMVVATSVYGTEYRTEANWDTTDETLRLALLETETFETRTITDALGRVIEAHNPDGSITYPEYHKSSRLNRLEVQLKGDTTNTVFVNGITYNPKSQREQIIYGNGTQTFSHAGSQFLLICL